MTLSVVRDIAEISRIIESVVSVPIYDIEGIAKEYLVYSSTEEGVYSTYVLDLTTGSKKLVASNVYWQVAVSENSSKIVFLRDVAKGLELSKVFVYDLDSGKEEVISADMESQRIIGLAFDGERVSWSGATKDVAGIYLAKLIEGRVERILETKGREFVSDLNSRYVVGYGHIKGNPFSSELFVIDLAKSAQEVYTPREGSTNIAPKIYENYVLFASNYENGDKMRLYVLDLESKELREVKLSYSDMDAFKPTEFVDYGWTRDGLVWAIAKKYGTSKLFLDGALIGLDHGFVSSAALYRGKAYIVHSSLAKPPRILSIDLSNKTPNVLVKTSLPEEIERRLGEVKFVLVESFDGLKIPTYVLESRMIPKPGPVVVYPHGGPWSEVSDSWWPMIAALAALGYHVVAPNFRGSTGYGEKFRSMDIGDPGGADMEDVAAARNWVVISGFSREDQVSIVGYSYGGYTTLMQLTKKPKLWRCGVAGAPVSDWVKMYETSDAYYRTFIEILFGGRKDLFHERSPINYVENIESPLCIIHPQNDSRTPVGPILDFTKELVNLGKSFELHILPGVGHLAILDKESLTKFLVYTAMFLTRCYQDHF
ncbi:MAG: alpha/beta fold hydrolase [Sulfolobales archaeon]|nr:alpha/beta fold hydrolase [Sulfolobales archaeon]